MKGLGRAVITIIKTRGEKITGGSGITQQLVKNTFLTQDKTLIRKVKEMAIALEMDDKYTKLQILEFYLNNSYFANRCYTIEAASNLYFDKSAKDLTLSESAYLCAILNAPTAFDPFQNPNAAIPRRNLILNEMYAMGDISQSEYNAAINEEIIIRGENANET